MDLHLETLAVSSVAEGIYHVELNRPRNLNAMNYKFWHECKQVFDALSADGDCRVILLTGRGRAFSAGLDIMDSENQPPHAQDAARRGFKFMGHVKCMQDAISALEACQKPVVAVVHGAVIGGAIDLITAADVRLCTADAKFCIKEAKIGLAADIGTLARLPRVVSNDSVMRELALTARDFSAEEAKSIGLVSRILPTLENALADAKEVAAQIAENSPVAVVGTKVNLNYARNHTVQECLDHVLLWNAVMIQTDDLPTALTASMQKTKPHFSKL
jgi:delta(3,5)-delta(2,4)-dienoyl-CoA isomerase